MQLTDKMNHNLRNKLLFASDGLRLTLRSTKNRIISPKKYTGNTEEICRRIIKDCFHPTKKYFRVSPNNFSQFYSRDFGMCCESLLYLGYKKEVRETIIYAMDIFARHKRITTAITPFGTPVDFPSFTPESASYMLNSIILLNDKEIIAKNKDLFTGIAEHIYDSHIDKNNGLLRKDIHYSSMKDHALRQSDCYNNCMLALFAKNLKKIKVKSSLDNYDYKKATENNFLIKNKQGRKYFLEDLSGSKIFASDANIFPFWTNLFDVKEAKNKKLFVDIIQIIQEKKLDFPWPLKYTTKEDASKTLHIADVLVPGYEKDTIWMHLGLCYLKAIKDLEPKLLKNYLDKYQNLILDNKTFHEVFDSNGKIFSRLLYKSDEAMLWCSIFLELQLSFKKNKNTKSY
jgi:hypothetical protein